MKIRLCHAFVHKVLFSDFIYLVSDYTNSFNTKKWITFTLQMFFLFNNQSVICVDCIAIYEKGINS
jgi:hypothetical protein